MKTPLFGFAVAAAVALSQPAAAHHSFAMFDRTKQVALDGVIKEFQWTSPHAWIQIVAPDASGAPKEWSIECGAPGMMVRTGWTSRTLKPGDKVTLTINPLRTGGPSGSLVKATLADGRVMGPGGAPPPLPVAPAG